MMIIPPKESKIWDISPDQQWDALFYSVLTVGAVPFEKRTVPLPGLVYLVLIETFFHIYRCQSSENICLNHTHKQ